MEIFNTICHLLNGGSCLFALYMCRDYSKMLEKSRDRFVETYRLADKYKEMYESEKRKNEKQS